MSSNQNGVVLLLVGAVVGIAIWALLRPKPKEQSKVQVESSPLKNIYQKVTKTPLPDQKVIETVPLPPSPPSPPSPSLYTTDNYQGPMGVPVPEGVLRDYPVFGDYPSSAGTGFVGSTYFGPAKPVDTTWVKLGILVNGDKILDLYGREIAPAQELYQYQAKDKNGFFIPLYQNWLLEEGDIINNIPGKPGSWKIVNQQRYVWV